VGRIKIIIMVFSLVLMGAISGIASETLAIPESDSPDDLLIGFFDLRDRETFIQITNVDSAESETVHVQIFNVADNCNENNFFDTYTPNDTHTYNLRDILTNDGNPSGVVLPDNAYGVISVYRTPDPGNENFELIGNLRVLDDNGYEYRTNLSGTISEGNGLRTDFSTFNFNNESGVTLSDIIIIPFNNLGIEEAEIDVASVLEVFRVYDVDIYDLDENPFSCRNVIFACINQDSPLIEEILNPDNLVQGVGGNVASFEYGINEAISHSKGGELLCPGNNISEGIVRLKQVGTGIPDSFQNDLVQVSFVGLNNGNGRGSMDAAFLQNNTFSFFNPF